MPNTIESAVRYIKNEEELAKIFASTSTTGSWEKPNVFIGARTVKIQRVTLGTTVLGNFDRETGYTASNISIDWIEKTLTQDKGDSLYIDKMDNEEAQANGIVGLHNRYIKQVQVPSVDKYRYAEVLKTVGIRKRSVALTKDNIIKTLLDDFTYLTELGVDLSSLELRISPTTDSLLTEASINKGLISIGNWNGVMDATVRMFKTAKIIVVPEAILQADYILAHPIAISAQKKYQETVFFDTIPGFGNRRSQFDEGIYHDCYVEPGAELSICVNGSKIVTP